MSTLLSPTQTKKAAIKAAIKAAKKEFTRRGQLLTLIEQANAKIGITQHKPCYQYREGIFELSLTAGGIVRGYWVAINNTLVQLEDEQDEEKSAWVRIAHLSTGSLADVEKFLTGLAENR